MKNLIERMPAAGRILTVTLLLAMGGCLIGTHTTEDRSGNYVPESTFDQIQVGQTKAGWVRATLGAPSEITPAEDSEIWKWTYTEHRSSSGHIFLLFDGSDQKTKAHSAFVEIKDNVVVRKWRS